MSNTINIGSRVFNEELGWGYVRERKGDMLGVEFDKGNEFHLIEKVYLFAPALTKETFLQFMFNRPGKVGEWRRIDYIAVQIALFALLFTGIAAGSILWRCCTISIFGWIQGVMHSGHYRKWMLG